MSPDPQRHIPLHLQISGYYKQQILDGGILAGDRMPSVRDIAGYWHVNIGTAARAVEHLKVEGLVRTGPEGTFAASKRAKIGPQQRMRLARAPIAERVEMRAAEQIPALEYVATILGLATGNGVPEVVRREWVTYEDSNVPFMLSVSWCSARFATPAPQLLDMWPLPDPGGAAAMISSSLGWEVTGGRVMWETRPILDDGREGPLLRLAKGSYVNAVVYLWWHGDVVLEYGEFITLPGKVMEIDMEP